MLPNAISFAPLHHLDGRVDHYEVRIFDQEVALISPNNVESSEADSWPYTSMGATYNGWRVHGAGTPEELRKEAENVPLWNAFQRVKKYQTALTHIALARLASVEDLEGALALKKSYPTL